jgi:hypothetical protein
MNTYYMLFHERESRPYAKALGIDLRILDAYYETYTLTPGPPRYEYFPIYAARLEEVIYKMREWRPQTLGQWMIKPYGDGPKQAYYTFWLSIIVGGFGLVSVLLSIVQIYAQFKTNPPSLTG